MITGRKFILDLLFIKYSVLRWEINMRRGAGWGGGGTEIQNEPLPGWQLLCVGGAQGVLGAKGTCVREAVGVGGA